MARARAGGGAAALPPAPGAVAPEAILALRARDGTALRAGLWFPEPGSPSRGLALLLTGRTEFLEKVAMTATALTRRGFAVASLDWRGQGLSARLVAPPEKGHVADFAEYLDDLAALTAAREVAALGPPRLVVGHSMGGAIALEALAAGRLPPVPMVLSAPMFGIRLPLASRAVLRASIAIGRAAGLLGRWPPVPGARRPYPLAARFEDNLLTGDRAVWDWLSATIRADPRLGLGLPSLGWFAAAEAAMGRIAAMPPPRAPGLVLLGDAERVVDPEAVATGAVRLGLQVARIREARHEPLIDAPEPRAEAWAAVDAFLAREAAILG